MNKLIKSFFICFAAFIVSGILTAIIAGKDAWLLINPNAGNQITIITPEYRKMQWEAMIGHPWLILPALISIAAIVYFLYNFYMQWRNFGSNSGFGKRF